MARIFHICIHLVSYPDRRTDGAWEFVRFCLSADQQRLIEHGLPVNQAVLQEQIDARLAENEITEADVAQFYEVLHGTELLYGNPSISSIISEETQAYFTGRSSAEAVADAIEDRLSILFAEIG